MNPLVVYTHDPKLRHSGMVRGRGRGRGRGRASSPDNEAWRYRLAEYIKAGKFKLNICEIESMFLAETAKVLSPEEKGSASNSIILFGALKVPLTAANTEVVAKIYFTSKDPAADNSLQVEQHVYKEIVWNLLKMHVTPNLMLYIGYAECDLTHCSHRSALLREITDERDRSIKNRPGFQNRYDYDHLHILLTERSNGKKLKDYILNQGQGQGKIKSLPWEDWYVILFQLIYTIQCFVEIGFMHNDLHAGNVFVTEIPETTFVYVVRFETETKMFKIRTKYMLRIYDFDFSTFRSSPFLDKTLSIKQNTKVRPHSRMCQEKGVCQDVNWYTDLFRVFAGISKAERPRELRTWLGRYANMDLLRGDTAATLTKKGILCKSPASTGNTPQHAPCVKLVPSSNDLKPPLFILEHGFEIFESSVRAEYLVSHQPHVYATPSSRVIFPPSTKQDCSVHSANVKP
jgi:hypothetical protein